MMNDNFTKQITSKLDGLARTHKDKASVMNNVLETIQDKSNSRYSFWKMGGFALAAAITGIAVLPGTFDMTEKQHQQQVVVSPKLSPQMVEDLEMLSVFGEDKSSHGS
ncbi:hypothetical protein [Acinetobacter gerneri]|nr:hypothetical protein [Acinetobacter gerneri]MCH4245537.1 hypothetical protein [Acinetobacter gerneri]MDV2440305.1 hypothetical protein [Acinetobacter gerneri]